MYYYFLFSSYHITKLQPSDKNIKTIEKLCAYGCVPRRANSLYRGLHNAVHTCAQTIFKISWFPVAQRGMEKNNKKNARTFDLLHGRIWNFIQVCVDILVTRLQFGNVVWTKWKVMVHFVAFPYTGLYMWTGNQLGGHAFDDLQNLLDMTSHEKPLDHFQMEVLRSEPKVPDPTSEF